MLTSDIYFESHPVSKVSVNLKRMLGSLMARSNDVVINVHVLTDDDGKSWVEDTILNVIGRHLTEGVVFGFENNNVTLQRKYLGGKIDQELLKVLLLFKNDIQDVMKIATGQRGEELDKEKYKMLVAEYKKFKTKSVKHYKFNSAANLRTFGKDKFVQ